MSIMYDWGACPLQSWSYASNTSLTGLCCIRLVSPEHTYISVSLEILHFPAMSRWHGAVGNNKKRGHAIIFSRPLKNFRTGFLGFVLKWCWMDPITKIRFQSARMFVSDLYIMNHVIGRRLKFPQNVYFYCRYNSKWHKFKSRGRGTYKKRLFLAFLLVLNNRNG